MQIKGGAKAAPTSAYVSWRYGANVIPEEQRGILQRGPALVLGGHGHRLHAFVWQLWYEWVWFAAASDWSTTSGFASPEAP